MNVREKLARVRLVVLDVDGVLTDGRIFYADSGEQIRAFHVRDGMGLALWHKDGGRTAILTSKSSPAVTARAREIGIEQVQLGISDKAAGIRVLAQEMAIPLADMCYAGDDIMDIGALRLAGCAVTVADAPPEVKKHADVVLRRSGGRGAVRELIEQLLKARQSWRRLVGGYY